MKETDYLNTSDKKGKANIKSGMSLCADPEKYVLVETKEKVPWEKAA